MQVAELQRLAASYAALARHARDLEAAHERSQRAGARVVVGAAGIDHWTDQDLLNFQAMAGRLGMRAADLLLVLYSESGLKPYAAAKNADGYPVAVGLNQLTSVVNSALGLTEDERIALLDKTVAEQLPYVEKSLRVFNKYKLPDAGALYALNFAPARLAQGADGNVVLYDSQKDPAAYASNKGVDHGKKGFINIEDMRVALRRNRNAADFQKALARYKAVTGDQQDPLIWPPPTGSGEAEGSPWPWLLGGLVVIGAGVVAYKRFHKARP